MLGPQFIHIRITCIVDFTWCRGTKQILLFSLPNGCPVAEALKCIEYCHTVTICKRWNFWEFVLRYVWSVLSGCSLSASSSLWLCGLLGRPPLFSIFLMSLASPLVETWSEPSSALLLTTRWMTFQDLGVQAVEWFPSCCYHLHRYNFTSGTTTHSLCSERVLVVFAARAQLRNNCMAYFVNVLSLCASKFVGSICHMDASVLKTWVLWFASIVRHQCFCDICASSDMLQ